MKHFRRRVRPSGVLRKPGRKRRGLDDRSGIDRHRFLIAGCPGAAHLMRLSRKPDCDTRGLGSKGNHSVFVPCPLYEDGLDVTERTVATRPSGVLSRILVINGKDVVVLEA